MIAPPGTVLEVAVPEADAEGRPPVAVLHALRRVAEGVDERLRLSAELVVSVPVRQPEALPLGLGLRLLQLGPEVVQPRAVLAEPHVPPAIRSVERGPLECEEPHERG